MAFVAMNLAAGGTLNDYSKGIAYAKALLPTSRACLKAMPTNSRRCRPDPDQVRLQLIALANQEKAKASTPRS